LFDRCNWFGVAEAQEMQQQQQQQRPHKDNIAGGSVVKGLSWVGGIGGGTDGDEVSGRQL